MGPRIAIAGWFGSGNLGDELILRALIRNLRDLSADPMAVTLDSDHTWLNHRIDSVVHRSPRDHRRLAAALRRADGLLLAGGLIQDETSAWNLPFHAGRIWAAGGMPTAAVGLGAGRVRGRWGRTLANRMMRRASPVVARDRDSATRLGDLGVRGVRVGADPVLSLPTEPVAAGNTMCVILRPPNRPGPGTAAAKARPPSPEEAQRLAEALDAAASALGFTIRMTAFHADRDGPVHEEVARRLTTPAELLSPAPDEAITEVGRSRLVVAMRYHGAVAALLADRPALLIDYSPKMRSLAAEGGGWAPLLDYRELNPDRLREAAGEAMERPERATAAREEMQARLGVNRRALEEAAACAT